MPLENQPLVTLESQHFVPIKTRERSSGSGLGRDALSGLSYRSLRGLLGELDRTVLAAVLAGLLSTMVLAAVAGRTARVSGAAPPSSWLGLLDPIRPSSAIAVGAVEMCAVAVLVLAWWCLLKAARRLRPRAVVVVGMLWAAPLALGPPLLSLDAYSYIAQGRLAALGIDPYNSPPAALYGAWLRGVDPFWRFSLSPYGPLAVLLERMVALTGSPVVALVLLHLLALGALGLVAVVVRHFAPCNQRSVVILLTVLNPLVLLQLLGAAHWEALLVALIAAALLAWQRGHPEAAIALASAAAAVKLPAGFAVAVLLMLHVFGGPQGRRLRNMATGAGAAAAPWLMLSFAVPNAIGFVGALATPMNGLTLYAPTTLLAEGVAYLWGLTGGLAPFDAILSVCRAGGMLLAAGVCCALLMTASRRAAGTTIGLGLLVVALLGPILYPWYFAWGLVPLALASRRFDRLLALLTSVMIFTALPGLEKLGEWLFALGPVWALTIVTFLLLVGASALVNRFGHLRESGARALPASAELQTLIRAINSWRPLGTILGGAVSDAQVRNRPLMTWAEKMAPAGPGVFGPGSMSLGRLPAGSLREEVATKRINVVLPNEYATALGVGQDATGLVPLVSSLVEKGHPACAHAIEVIVDHSQALAPPQTR